MNYFKGRFRTFCQPKRVMTTSSTPPDHTDVAMQVPRTRPVTASKLLLHEDKVRSQHHLGGQLTKYLLPSPVRAMYGRKIWTKQVPNKNRNHRKECQVRVRDGHVEHELRPPSYDRRMCYAFHEAAAGRMWQQSESNSSL